ncbi:Asp/Glu/hydantoin racemase [Humitalea rosea]|uniref:Asp/Glu/hydantoin racemase n=1 Tax=Humitalea rosea TaxID=990373 RepID=A0A2W7IGF0_9PROT|nr:aspartate/glutamate racemase family protein [Humitalea rosea]PZW45666.1 Asp/Glu/hydantoin racemase [Humitalea rosea]
MRLLLLNGNTDPAITRTLARRARVVLDGLGHTEVALVPATARFGARYVASRASAAIAAHAVLEAVAEHFGQFDAVAIACFGDPGLEAVREIFPGPVTGMAEASLTLALRLAPRIAFLTGGAAWVPMLREFCALRGAGREVVDIRSIPPTGDLIARDPAAAAVLLSAEAQAAAEAGAGAVVLGGAGLAGMAEMVTAPVPVLDSLDCLLKEAAARHPRTRPPRPAPTPSQGLAESLGRALAGLEPGKAS